MADSKVHTGSSSEKKNMEGTPTNRTSVQSENSTLNSYDAVTNKKQAQEQAQNPDMREA